MSPRETPKETLGYWGYRGAEWLAMSLPERTGRRVFETMGRVAHHRLAGVRTTVAANQARVLGADPTDERVLRATREAFEL
jgi:lauroyl/myristoyl acyltransferase